jgi:hypothetical protein
MGCCLVVMITGVMAIEGKNMDQVADRACQPIDFEEEWPWGFLSADLKDLLQRMLEVSWSHHLRPNHRRPGPIPTSNTHNSTL